MTPIQWFFTLLWVLIVWVWIPVFWPFLLGAPPSMVLDGIIGMLKVPLFLYQKFPAPFAVRYPHITYGGECSHVIVGIQPFVLCYILAVIVLMATFVWWLRRPGWRTFWATILVGWVLCGLPGGCAMKALTDGLPPIAYYTAPCTPADYNAPFTGPPSRP